MKCCAILALASGAYAAQDVTPPVVSLSLPTDANYDDLDCKTESCGKSTQASKSGMRSVTCEVGAADSVDACPEPVCKAYDHHDHNTSCQTKRVLVNNDGMPVNDYVCHKDDDSKLLKTNSDGETTNTASFTACNEELNRNLRSEWLLTYSAEDAAGNEAEKVSFTMIFRDTQRPVITTPWGDSSTGHCDETTTKTIANFEACSGPSTAPCAHDLGTAVTSNDNYDQDVSPGIYVSLVGTANNVDSTDVSVVRQLQDTIKTNEGVLNLDTKVTGDWVLEYDSSDNAGIFGCGETSNKATFTIDFKVVDTTAPVITLNNHADTLECGVTPYDEAGANCVDARDQWNTAAGRYEENQLPSTGATPGTVVGGCQRFYLPEAGDYDTAPPNWSAAPALTCGFDSTKAETTFTVAYNCNDSANPPNQATEVVRTLTVVDTRAPSIQLKGEHTIENSAGADASHTGHNSAYEHATNTEGKGLHLENIGMKCDPVTMKCEGGATCTDECDSFPQMKAELFYGACGAAGDSLGDVSNFPEYTSGDYHIVYTCTDGHKTTGRTPLSSTICRNIQNVDHTLPVIQILGSDVMTLEATHDGNYVDDGATCSDQVDGVISQNVEVSGDVVNLSKVGSYEITYNCKDSAGNSAPTMKRTVHVAQTSCPTCVINGNVKQHHEASFPYSDEGVTCNDLIDGSLDTSSAAMAPVGPEGNSGVSSAITTIANMVEHVGTYFVTYRVVNSVGLWNDGKCRGTSNTYVRTVVIEDTLKPVIQIKYKNVEVARSSGADKSNLSGVTRDNPAYQDGKDAGHFMAEETTSSANGWVIGAVASAVTGLALLGFSQRKAATVTSVPV